LKSILLSLIFIISTSCTEGQKDVTVYGAKTPLPPTHSLSGYTYLPSPAPPDEVFAPLGYPFSRNTDPFELTIAISNPNSDPYTHKWCVNGEALADCINTDQDNTPLEFTVDPSDSLKYPDGGVQTVTSSIYNAQGIKVSSVSWWFEIWATADPHYTDLSPPPAPSLFPGSPFTPASSSTTITVTIANPESTPYKHKWWLDDQEQSETIYPTAPTPFVVVPSNSTLFPSGTHTVVSQITEFDDTVISSASWTFVIVGYEDPKFTTFTGQWPSPAPFPDVDFGSTTPIVLDPDTLDNPDLQQFYLEWSLNSVLQASDTFFNPETENNDPDPFTIDVSDMASYPPGTYSVDLTLISDQPTSISTLLSTRNWTFNVVYPPPTTLEDVLPPLTDILAVASGVPLDASSSGFYRNPPTDNTSRGTSLVIGDNSFCVEVADGRGIGWQNAPNLAGVRVNFYDNDNKSINSGGGLLFEKLETPPKLCLDGTGALSPSDGNGDPNFSYAFDPPERTSNYPLEAPLASPRTITAVISDILTLQEVARVQWSMTLEQMNTPPEIKINTNLTLDGATIPQDATFTFGVTVSDKDSLDSTKDSWPTGIEGDYGIEFYMYDSYTGLNVPLQGDNWYFNDNRNPLTPDCVREATETGFSPEELKFQCTLMIPSSNGNVPAGVNWDYKIRARVQDTQTNILGAPEWSSPTLYLDWDINVLETNSAPFLQNIVTSATATADVLTDSFVYENDPTKLIISAVEFATITFNLHVDDFEKDDFFIELSHNSSTSPIFQIFEPPPPATPTLKTISGDSYLIIPYQIPGYVVESAATATISFRVSIIDNPDTVPGIPYTYDFDIVVSDVNFPPEVGSPTTYTPDLNDSAYIVMEGFPFTFVIDDIRDQGTGPGADLTWQWQNLTSSGCATATTGAWNDIIGANQLPNPKPAPQVATLTWSPSNRLDGTYSCFRNCIGDNGVGHPADCSITTAGPWIGNGVGVGITYSIAADSTIDPAPATPTSGYTDIWMDEYEATGTFYTIHTSDNEIVVVKQVYDDMGNIDQSTRTSYQIDGGLDANDRPIHVSVTGTAFNIYIGFMFWDEDHIPRNPRAAILRFDKDLTNPDEKILDDVVSGIGQIVADTQAAYLPYLRTIENDNIWLYSTDSTVNWQKQDLGLAAPSSKLVSGGYLFGTNDFHLLLSAHVKTGELNIYEMDLPDVIVPATVTVGDFDVNVFQSTTFHHFDMGVGNSTNGKVYLAAQDESNNLIYTSRLLSDLSEDGGLGVITKTPTDIPPLLNLKSMQAVAGRDPDLFFLGVISGTTGPNVDNAFAIRIEGDGSSFDQTKDVSKRVNNDENLDMLAGNNDQMSLSRVYEFQVGYASPASPGENIKDTLWFRYIDGTNGQARMTLINTERENFSSSDPTNDQNDDWTRPWFKQ